MAKERDNIPVRRFPQFVQEKGWNYVNANELFEPIVNKNHNSDLPVLAITQDQGAVPREKIDYNVIVSEKSIAGYKVVEVGDFIISLRSFQGGIEYSYYKGLCSPAYIVLRKKNDTICNDFYRHYFKSWQFIQDLNRNLEGIRDGKMVSYQQFSEILIPYPSFVEQQKIADCLSSIDELIKISSGKLEMLKIQKEGLMQQLLTPINGGGNSCVTPTLRFPKFKNTKGWEIKMLENIVKLFTAAKKLTLVEYKKSGEYPIVDQSQQYISGYTDDGTALINENKEGVVIFGDHTCSLKYIDFPFVQGADGIKIFKSSEPERVMSQYIYYYLCSVPIKSTEYKRHFSDLKKKAVLFPSLVTEQQRLIECFLSIDEVITSCKQKQFILEQHKKGLMQQLFPKYRN